MRSVAIGFLLAVLASAPGGGLIFFDLNDDGYKACPFVRSITERLIFRLSAGAPGIFAGFHVHDVRVGLRDARFVHLNLLFIKRPPIKNEFTIETASILRTMGGDVNFYLD